MDSNFEHVDDSQREYIEYICRYFDLPVDVKKETITNATRLDTIIFERLIRFDSNSVSFYFIEDLGYQEVPDGVMENLRSVAAVKELTGELCKTKPQVDSDSEFIIDEYDLNAIEEADQHYYVWCINPPADDTPNE